jgi:hypothetical protein
MSTTPFAFLTNIDFPKLFMQGIIMSKSESLNRKGRKQRNKLVVTYKRETLFLNKKEKALSRNQADKLRHLSSQRF